MTDALIVFCTCSTHAEASKLANAVVNEGLAACVNIVPAVESVYSWEGEIQTSQEFLLLIKTTQERFPALSDLIVKLHSYDTPEIIALSIAEGSAKYLEWLGATIST
jgi:periplasmic divalent cation tolerance protein